MNIWHDINPERISRSSYAAVIEISKGSKMKYELDKETGLLRLDRVLHTSTHYPANYGFIPRTLSEDGDPLDVLVLCQSEIIPLCLVECRPIGVIKMIDNDMIDEKIIGYIRTQLEKNGEDYAFLVMPDHPTPVSTKTHSREAVPCVIYKKGEKNATGYRFTEEDARKYGKKIDVGHSLMKLFLEK